MTQCAVLTSIGRSAIAAIAVVGSEAPSIVATCFRPTRNDPLEANQIRFGQWRGTDSNAPAEDVVVCPRHFGPSNEPRSGFEVLCHGGSAATQRIIDDICRSGGVVVDSWQLSASGELLIDEATQVASECTTTRTTAIALHQQRGALLSWVEQSLLEISEDPDSHGLIVDQAKAIAKNAAVTSRISQPRRVILVGPPNVGKSSLMNAIVGYDRSIALEIAGTTRDVLTADTVIDGLPIRISDTAGLRENRAEADEIERQGMGRALQAVRAADLLIIVSDPQQTCGEKLSSTTPHLRVMNKVDLIANEEQIPKGTLATSTVSGQGMEELMQRISEHFGAQLPHPGEPTAINQRQATALGKIACSTTTSELIHLLDLLRNGQDDGSF